MKKIVLLMVLFVSSAALGVAQNNPTLTESKRRVRTVQPAAANPMEALSGKPLDQVQTQDNRGALPRLVNLDSPLRIIQLPRAAYPRSETGTICMQGTVRLRVEFLPDGTIGNISKINTLPYGATENSIAAARKIVFQPALKNGVPVKSTYPVSFSFSY